MTTTNVIEFLRTVAARPDVLDSLKTRSKDDVIDAAAGFGYPFSEADFDSIIWDLEAKLAGKRGEQYDVGQVLPRISGPRPGAQLCGNGSDLTRKGRASWISSTWVTSSCSAG